MSYLRAKFELAWHDAAVEYRIEWPVAMADLDWAMQEVKGWIAVTVVWEGGQRALSFYDPVTLAQSVATELETHDYFTDGSLVVVPKVTLDASKARSRPSPSATSPTFEPPSANEPGGSYCRSGDVDRPPHLSIGSGGTSTGANPNTSP